MARFQRQPEASRTVPQVAAGHEQAHVVLGQRAAYGARLPYPDEVLTVQDIAAILFPHLAYPKLGAFRWINRWRVPTKTVGNSIRVTGASFLAALSDADKKRRDARAKRQRTQLRRVG